MSSGKRCPRADCPHEGKLQPLENFHRNRSRPDGHASHCKDCANASNRRRRSKTGRGWLRYRKPDGFSGVGTPADLICDDFEVGMLRVRASLEEFCGPEAGMARGQAGCNSELQSGTSK